MQTTEQRIRKATKQDEADIEYQMALMNYLEDIENIQSEEIDKK